MRYITFLILISITFGSYGQQKSSREAYVDTARIDSLLIELDKKIADTVRVNVLTDISETYHNVNFDSLGVYAARARILAKEIGYKKGLAQNHYQLGYYYTRKREYKLAQFNLYQALDIYETEKNDNGRAKVYLEIGFLRTLQQKYVTAEKAFMSGFKIAKRNDDQPYLVSSYRRLSVLKRRQNKPDWAFKYATRALNKAKKIKDPLSLVIANQNFGYIYVYESKYRSAIKMFEKALEKAKDLGDIQLICGNLNALGDSYNELKKYDKAITFLEEAISLGDKVVPDYLIGQYYAGLGKSYFGNKEYTKALVFYKRGLNNIERDGYELRINVLNNIGKAYFKLEEFQTARYYYNKALEMSNKHLKYDFKTKVKNYNALIELNITQEDYKGAFSLQKKLQGIKDSMSKVVNNEKYEELKAKFISVENENKIKDLNTLNREQEIEMIKKDSRLNLTIGTLCSLIVFGLVFFFVIRRSNGRLKEKSELIQTTNKELEKSKIELSNSLEEKDILLKEIHHRVKNNMQLVLSLLDIEARGQKSKEIEEFIEKGYSRISSMALIHQTLYETEDLSKVDFQQYIEKLIHTIYKSFGFDENKVGYLVNANEHHFDIQTAIPLGLIINELVCNSLKHAFPKNKNGDISVTLDEPAEGKFQLGVKDNGIGIDTMKKRKNSLGLELVSLLTIQLEGELSVNNNNGAEFVITF